MSNSYIFGTPLYEHDCDQCKFLGRFESDKSLDGKKTTFDLYLCGDTESPTVVARYGVGPSEYKSGLIFAVQHIFMDKDFSDPLSEALRRAFERNLVEIKRRNK